MIASKANTLLNIVRPGRRVLVEQFGKYMTTRDPGFFFSIPLVHRLTEVDIRETAFTILPQAAVTKDNVRVNISGAAYVRITDPYLATFNAEDVVTNVIVLCEAGMRNAIGEVSLDDALTSRNRLNTYVSDNLREPAADWGCEITRYEVTDIMPDAEIQKDMDRQASAERKRREQIAAAEGDKKETILRSEGVLIALENESKGELISKTNLAEAERITLEKRAQGEAFAIQEVASAKADSLQFIASRLQNNPESLEAMRYLLAGDYMENLGKMAGESNTMVVPADLSNVASMIKMAKTL